MSTEYPAVTKQVVHTAKRVHDHSTTAREKLNMQTAELHAGERAAEDIDVALATEARNVADAKRRVVERIIEAKTRHNRTNVAIAATLGITEGAVRAMIKRTQL